MTKLWDIGFRHGPDFIQIVADTEGEARDKAMQLALDQVEIDYCLEDGAEPPFGQLAVIAHKPKENLQ